MNIKKQSLSSRFRCFWELGKHRGVLCLLAGGFVRVLMVSLEAGLGFRV